jgi:hypothetical protein
MAKPSLTVGDRVKFTRNWLGSTCSMSTPVARLKGTVQTVWSYPSGLQMATVRWDVKYFDTMETNVLSANLQRLR